MLITRQRYECKTQVSPLTVTSGFALRARYFLAAKKYRKKADPTPQPLRGALCCSTKRAHSQTRLTPQTWLSFIAFGLRCSAGDKGGSGGGLTNTVLSVLLLLHAVKATQPEHTYLQHAPVPTAFYTAEQRSSNTNKLGACMSPLGRVRPARV